MYKIEEGIPIPKQVRNGESKIKKFLQSVPVGASFLLEGEDAKAKSVYVRDTARRNGIKICTRTVEGGCRVWRLS